MKWKRGIAGFILKGIVICISFVGVFAITYHLNQMYLREMAETALVVAVKETVLPGCLITQEMLHMTERPAFGLSADKVEDIALFLEAGPWYAGETGFGSGDILLLSRLRHERDMDGDWRWAFNQQEDARLIAVETSLVRSGGDWLWPGMIVDAIVYIPGRESYEEKRPSEMIGPDEDPLLGGLLVVDKKNAGGVSLDEPASAEGYSRDALPSVVTLMIHVEDTERLKALIRYNEEGRIYFSPVVEYNLGVEAWERSKELALEAAERIAQREALAALEQLAEEDRINQDHV